MSKMDFSFEHGGHSGHAVEPRLDAATPGTPDAEISVIMPVYNAAATLEPTVASVLEQTFAWFELIVIDDGSSDDSLARLLNLAAGDPRIKVVACANGGVSAARNMGVELARAPLIAFLDADDLWVPTKLACHVALHRDDPALAASYARIAFIDQDATSIAGARTLSSLCPHSPQLVDVLGENPVCTASNFVVRRDWFCDAGGFDQRLHHAEDQDFVARIISRGGRIAGVDAVLTGYRFSPDGLSMELAKMHEGWRTVAGRYLSERQFAALEAIYCRYLARRVLRSGGRPREALRYVAIGLRLDAHSFLAERRRGVATIAGAIAAHAMPQSLRLRLFA
jgi:hypothetical protein